MLEFKVPDYFEKAACSDYDKSDFFPSYENETSENIRIVEAAKAICRDCVVINDCREYAEELNQVGPLYGVWGGVYYNAGKIRSRAGAGRPSIHP